jgi:hypothetical protein
MHNKQLFIVSPHPIVPPIDTHDGIIKVNGSLTKQVAFETEVNIKDGADQACWINPNAFFS